MNGMKKKPWHVIDEKNIARNYAVCPSCNNPIQLIGLYTLQKNARRPYGKHTGKHISGFPHFDPDDYKSCPYFNPSLRVNQNNRRSKISPIVVKLLQRLRDDFDQIIALTESFCGFDISLNLAKKMLQHFTSGCHLYTGANSVNIPWIFAYMSGANNMYGRVILDTELKNSIKNSVKNAQFSEYDRLGAKPNTFYELNFNFILHRWKEVEGNLEEKMWLAVFLEDEKPFWKKAIIFDHAEKNQLFASINREHSSNVNLRELAREFMQQRFPNLDQIITDNAE